MSETEIIPTENKTIETKPNKPKRKIKVSIIIIILLIAIIISMAGWIYLHLQADARKVQEETPIESELVDNDYDWTKLTSNGSFMSYEDSKYTSLQGIDVSSHDEQIDWAKVKAAGVDFAYIRVGYTGWETGEIHKDTYFDYNIQSAKENGILVGVYYFSQATTITEVREEADFVLENIKNYEIDLDVCYDIEKAGEGLGRVDNLSRETWTQNAVTFLHIMENNGYKGMNYNSTNNFPKYFLLEYTQEFDTWVAHYGVDYPTYQYEFTIWQYTDSGSVDGIGENTVDMDIMFVKK